jgi:mitochondrial fission protein ELM1
MVKVSHTLWIISDGKPGHENQSLGLADAIARLTPSTIHPISLVGVSGPIARVRAALRACAELPAPDLIISAGHATHLPLVWLARKYHARSILLMRPSLPMGFFDLCIAPEHDFPHGHSSEKIILTRGALNRVAPSNVSDRSVRMILVGGPSKIHGWDSEALLLALEEIAATGKWQLTDSRRTPAGLLDEIRKRLPAIEVFPHQETSPTWLPGQLATAAEVWVTEDSVSMIYEALSSGANVGLLPVPRLKSDTRVLQGLEKIIGSGFITRFGDWQTKHHLAAPPDTLREADRCAAWIVENFTC